MRKNIVLFRPDIIVENNEKYMTEVADVFNLHAMNESGSFFFVKKDRYNDALKLKLEGKRIHSRISLRNYTMLDRLDPMFVKVTRKYYPQLIDFVHVEYGDLYTIRASSYESDRFELFDEGEWVKY